SPKPCARRAQKSHARPLGSPRHPVERPWGAPGPCPTLTPCHEPGTRGEIPMRIARTVRWSSVAGAIALLLALVPHPALAQGFPRTLAAPTKIGLLAERSPAVRPAFPVGYVGVSWASGSRPAVRFLRSGRWTQWQRVELDDMPSANGRTYSALVPADDASAYQLR